MAESGRSAPGLGAGCLKVAGPRTRAVAGAQAGLTSRATLARFALPASGTVSNTASALAAAEILVKVETAPATTSRARSSGAG